MTTPTRRLRDLYVSQKRDTRDVYEGRTAQLRMPRFLGNRGIHGQGQGEGGRVTLSVGRILQVEMLRVNRPDGLSLNGA
jgi:hypothetical protein